MNCFFLFEIDVYVAIRPDSMQCQQKSEKNIYITENAQSLYPYKVCESVESKCYWCNHRSGLMFPVLGGIGGLVDCFQSSCRHECMGITVEAAACPEEEDISHC